MSQRRVLASTLSHTLDKIASLIEKDCASLGLPTKVAADFAYRCDLIADAVDEVYGIRNAAAKQYDPKEIGMEVKGPEVGDKDEKDYMQGHFTQQSFRELSDLQTSGELADDPNLEPRRPEPGRQASRRAYRRR